MDALREISIEYKLGVYQKLITLVTRHILWVSMSLLTFAIGLLTLWSSMCRNKKLAGRVGTLLGTHIGLDPIRIYKRSHRDKKR